jgi:hypothetical protein
MNKIFVFFTLLLYVCLLLVSTGCSSDIDDNKEEDLFAQYYKDDFRDNKNGTVEIFNPTAYDMLLFADNISSLNNIVGGVRAGARTNVNFSTQNDFHIGGFVLLQAIKQSEVVAHGNQSMIDWRNLVIYGEGRIFTTTIYSTTDGDYHYMVSNMSQNYALELRKNSFNGKKVAFLLRGERDKVIRSPSNAMVTLYPVWVAFNTLTRSLVTFVPTSPLSAQTAAPAPVSLGSHMLFFGQTLPDDIFSGIQIPYAILQVTNNTSGVVNLKADNTIVLNYSGFQGINSGLKESYQIIPVTGGINLNLFALASVGIPVRFESDPDASTVIIENGYLYTVSLNLKPDADPTLASSYEAWLVKEDAIDGRFFLISP